MKDLFFYIHDKQAVRNNVTTPGQNSEENELTERTSLGIYVHNARVGGRKANKKKRKTETSAPAA